MIADQLKRVRINLGNLLIKRGIQMISSYLVNLIILHN